MNACPSDFPEYVTAPDPGAPIDHSARPRGPRYGHDIETLSNGREIRVVRSSPIPPEPARDTSRDEELLYAEARLLVWAEWAKAHRSSLGYPSVSTLYRAMLTSRVGVVRGGALPEPKVIDRSAKSVEIEYANGALGSETRSFRPLEECDAPDAIMEIDRAVALVPPRPKQVLIAHYFGYGPIEERCRKTPYKRARYLQLLETGKYAVYMALAAGLGSQTG